MTMAVHEISINGKKVQAQPGTTILEAARENGISGLFAYTSPENQRMMRLFMSLPYKVRTLIDGDVLLSCKFSDTE